MKSLVFDTSTIISLSTNDLLWVLKSLKDKFNGDFLISNGVKEELIDHPLQTKKFKFEALNIISLINDNYLKIYSSKEISEKREYLDNLLNHMFKAKDEYITIMHKGEIESLAVAIILNANAYAVDERTTRMVIEDPERLAKILRNKLHTTININKDNLNLFMKEVSNVKIIRSTELALIAYEDGIFKNLLKPNKYSSNVKKDLISGLLWGLRLRGCSISDEEINEALKIY
ncbi:MAG: hypothetical protein KJ623_00400 [Nanoarchaeota archaeon]|nr:hypothetical protein [Nanoarchaeota archaeon]MBU0962420.1 hypothetical protein [Nanoarchaeota archaeon]